MKFLRETTARGLRVLPAELAMAGFSETQAAEVHAAEDAIVVLKRRMTGMELIRAAAFAMTARRNARLRNWRRKSPSPVICGRRPASMRAPSSAPM